MDWKSDRMSAAVESLPMHSNQAAGKDIHRAFAIGMILNVGFILIELFFGLFANSLALLSDAGHNLSDVMGLALAWGASYLGKREATNRRTYGWKKTTILAALFNAIILLVAIGAIAWEAVHRFGRPVTVGGATVVWVAGAGVVVNGVTAWLFLSSKKKDLNIRGVFLHMAADAAVSLGVVLSGVWMIVAGWPWIDPAISLVVVVIVFFSTWGLLRDSFNLALDGVPSHIDTDAVKAYLANFHEISHVHDLHIWGMSTSEIALTAHLVKQSADNDDILLAEMREGLRKRFGIGHITIQWERGKKLRHGEKCR